MKNKSRPKYISRAGFSYVVKELKYIEKEYRKKKKPFVDRREWEAMN